MLLNLIGVLFAAVGSGILYACLEDLSPWWLWLSLPGFLIGWFVLYFAVLWIVSLFFPKKEPEKANGVCLFFVGITLDWLMRVMRVKITLSGTGLLPDCPCVIVSNHRSDFDPMTVLAVLRKRKLAYISKESNFKIPIVGPFIRRAGFLAIDRENGMRAMRTLKAASLRMKNEQMDMGIYPEGTRSKNGELLEFKTGAFYLAKRAEAPIVVMATEGTERISKNFPWRQTKVSLRFLKVIDTDTVKGSSFEDLAAQSRGILSQALSKDYGAL